MSQNRHSEEGVLKLYLADYRKELFLREISRESGVPLKSAQRLLNNLLEHNVLKSRETGKHKYFLVNFDNTLAKEYLLRTELAALISLLEDDFLLKKVYSEISSLGVSGAVVLFGSYAKRSQDKQSDIDLLYIGEQGEEFKREMKKLGSTYGKQINVKKTSPESFKNALAGQDALVREVLKNHILFSKPSIFVDSVWRYFCEIR